MTRARLRIRSGDFTAADARRMLEDLQSGPSGRAVLRYRELGGTFVLAEERTPETAPSLLEPAAEQATGATEDQRAAKPVAG